MKNKMVRGLVVAGMVSMMLTACGSKETLGTADTEVTKTTDEQEENTVPESAMETVEENVTKVDVETENETTTATQVEVLADVSREEKIDIIIDEIKKRTAVEAYELKIIEDTNPDIFDSKFGGLPYWDMSMEYPVDANQEKMMLLAQINFSKANLQDERLPQEGILQFFISTNDGMYGVDYENPDEQTNFRVIYHETIDESVTYEQIVAMDLPNAGEPQSVETPLTKEMEIEFCKTTSYMEPFIYGFEEVFQDILMDRFGEDIGEQKSYEYVTDDEYAYIYDEISNAGNRVLSYPFFTQYDPRDSMDEDKAEYYDTVLLQIDSYWNEKNEELILWGDMGVANFFINSEALQNKDFSQVMYSWDCM